ncbi:MAG: hypothetical protein ABIE84_01375 [bacterium]
MYKKNKILLIGMLTCLIFLTGTANAQLRTYRQTKDISATEKGKVRESKDKANLFEYTFDINSAKGIITRTKIRRLDQETPTDDNTIYKITQTNELLTSKAGLGGKTIVAVREDGEELLQLGHRFAFTTRTSPFSQIISGVYERVYTPEQKKRWQEKNN